ncbi:hypothetical protein BGZ60DRAFT_462084 [Tricladium varicosporioides]|nr:hypothetical protein BGZ60DRAFT_462084 [Hymenoscyphus varicosporioides]
MSHLSQEYVRNLYNTFGELKVLDDIIRHRAADADQVPILGYPRFENSVDDYEHFTGKQLDQFIDAAVKKYISAGLKPNTREVVGVLAPSNIDFIVSFFALSRLGYTVLCLSLRIAPIAVINLLQKTGCSTIVHGSSPQIEVNVQSVNQDFPIAAIKIPTRIDYDGVVLGLRFVRHFDREEENSKPAIIIHSSGSTGLPKPISLSHRALLTHPTQGTGLHNFNALPWYHLYGISTSLQAMWMRRTAHLYNVNLPLTADNLIAILEKIQPEAVHTVPYGLGLMAERQSGLNALKRCKVVTAAGARTPDELGDRLVKEGINFGVVFGTTEAGLVGDTMRRANGDDSWNYLRLYANIRKFLHMSPLGDGSFEMVYLKGHPALSASNSDDPAPGSWHSKDVFIPHKTIPDVWKYVTRIDDRVTLVNGEKVLPLPIEGRIREDELVREAVVVGVDQPIPGLLVFRSKAVDHMSDAQYIDAIWPSVADANSRAEAFSQITREMITPMPSNVDWPQTDKGSIIRAQCYLKFVDQIKDMYARLEGDGEEGTLRLDLQEMVDFIMTTFRETIGVPLDSPDVDFFAAGIDSLKAIQMRRIIVKTLELNGKQLTPNVVYENGNPRQLAKYLHALGKGEDGDEEGEASLMKEMVDKYSRFTKHHPPSKPVLKLANQAAILTGATGSIGAHTLAQVLANPEISKVYCLVRGENPMQRILDSLKERRLELPASSLAKIVAFVGDLSKPNFDLSPTIYAQMKKEVSLIVHIAWPVNFNIHLSSFEPHIAGLYNLLQFSLSVKRPQPAQLFFCSSISTAFNAPTPVTIPNAPIEDLTYASTMGYGQSKLVGEHIVRNAARAGAHAYVLRIGQVAGDSINGVWNDKEFIPSMIRSALTLKALPDLRERCLWLPVDILATTIIQLSNTLKTSKHPLGYEPEVNPEIFYNLLNPRPFQWSSLLTELSEAGLKFDTVPFIDWMEKLQESAAHGDELRNPAVKLIEFFEEEFGAQDSFEKGGLMFETSAAQRDAQVLREPPRIVEDGYIRKFLGAWLEKWE